MSIYIVCRYNQARSIIGAAAIRKLFPEITTISAGVEADENIPLPSSVLAVASEWGLPIVEKSSTPFARIVNELKDTDLILAADSFVLSAIQESNPRGRLTEFSDFTPNNLFTVVDPSEMPANRMKLELAKSICAALTSATRLTNEANSRASIQTVIPESDETANETRRKVWNYALENKAVVIDASLRASEISEWHRIGAVIERFDQSILKAAFTAKAPNQQRISSRVLAPAFEFADAPRTLLSAEWLNFVRSHAQSQATVVITPPASVINYLPDLALAAWHGPYSEL